ncbi:hypothetical protein Tco_0578105 [Tanacetum coccineum]
MDIPLDSVEVLRYEKKSKSENKGRVSTEMELVLEQTQQGTSHEVLVSTEGVEELKRKVKIKGEKKEALLTLRQKPGADACVCYLGVGGVLSMASHASETNEYISEKPKAEDGEKIRYGPKAQEAITRHVQPDNPITRPDNTPSCEWAFAENREREHAVVE